MNQQESREMLQWAKKRVGELIQKDGSDSEIERKDLMGSLSRYQRTSRPASKAKCLRRIAEWRFEKEIKLAQIKAKPGLVALFLRE